MPRSPVIPLLILALAASQGRAADQPRLPEAIRPDSVVDGVPGPDRQPGFVPRSRVQQAPTGSGQAAVTVVRGMRTSEPPSPTLATAPAIDPALLEALAALCRIDRRSETLALGLPGSIALPARF